MSTSSESENTDSLPCVVCESPAEGDNLLCPDCYDDGQEDRPEEKKHMVLRCGINGGTRDVVQTRPIDWNQGSAKTACAHRTRQQQRNDG